MTAQELLDLLSCIYIMVAYFYLILMIYNAARYLEEHKKKNLFLFVIIQVVLFLPSYYISVLILENFNSLNYLVKALSVAFVLLATDFIAIFIGRKKSEEKLTFPNRLIVYIGLIDGINIILIVLTFFFSIYLKKTLEFQLNNLPLTEKADEAYIDICKSGVSFIKDTIFFLGASIGVIMTILFSGTKWEDKKDEKTDSLKVVYYTCSRIILGFLLITISSFIWLIKPLSEKIIELISILNKF